MANTIDTQLIHDGETNVVQKYTANLTATDLSSVTLIDPSTLHPTALAGVPTKLRLMSINWALSNGLEATLTWDGATPALLMALAGRGEIKHPRYQGFINDATTPNGKILLTTTGATTTPPQTLTLTLQYQKQFT